MLKTAFENLRSRSPLIHNITNYVTVNDCANMVLACGASPIMADDAAEVEEITAICGGLNINIGTLNSRTVTSMLLAGKKANQLGHPVVLDPVGAGASHLRTDTAFRLLREVQFMVIRGNISEIKTLASGAGTTKGVDADVADKVTEENLDSAVAFAKAFAARTGAVIAITGAIDIVADAQKSYCIRNGNNHYNFSVIRIQHMVRVTQKCSWYIIFFCDCLNNVHYRTRICINKYLHYYFSI